MAARPAVGADAPTAQYHPDHIMPRQHAGGNAAQSAPQSALPPRPQQAREDDAPRRSDLHYYMRASGLAQARLQVAVMSSNRNRAFEQIDRLIAIDRQLERLTVGAATPGGVLEDDLTSQRRALASEKLALTAGVEMARLDPHFAAGTGEGVIPVEQVEIVEHSALNRRLLQWLLGGLAVAAASFAAVAAILLL